MVETLQHDKLLQEAELRVTEFFLILLGFLFGLLSIADFATLRLLVSLCLSKSLVCDVWNVSPFACD